MRIYIDTNILISEGWPKISAKLGEMLILSHASHISVVVPDAVERETKAHWFRYLETQLTKVAKEESKFAAIMEKIGEDYCPTTQDVFDLESAQKKYAETVGRLKSESHIISAPLTSMPLDTIFQMAINKWMPFEDRGVGFQDAVILLSTTEDLMRFPTESGILLSDDEIFSKGETRDLIARLGVDLKV